MARILVTGGAGFIGSHLCEKLLMMGHTVFCMDNFSTSNRANITHLISDPSFAVIEHDVTIPFNITVDVIYNLACPASPTKYQHDPIQTIKTSILGLINVLELAKTTRAKVFHASTSEIYGSPEVHPQHETYWGHVNPFGPRSCYNESKRCCESICLSYIQQHNVDVRIARIFNTYGPRMQIDDGRVISNFIVQALAGEDIIIYGSGEQTRSFCYVDDLVDGIISLMNTFAVINGPINLGNPDEITINNLATTIKQLCNSSSTITHANAAIDDPIRRQPNISNAMTHLFWSPRVNLNDGLNSTINYFRQLK